VITTAIFYAILRKTKILGDSIAVAAILSLSFSFLIWGYLVSIPSVGLGVPMAKFVTQFSVLALAFLFTILGASFFYPEMGSFLGRLFPGGTMFWIVLVLVLVIFFFTSGLGNIIGLQETIFKGPVGTIFLVLFFIFIGLIIASSAGSVK
jgi:hypothetical protein